MAREIVQKAKNIIVYSDGTIRIDNVRASYPHLDKPWAKNPDKDTPKFSLTGLALKETHDEVKKVIVEVMNKLLQSSKIGKLGSEHKFFRNGDDSGKDENEGHWIIKASENANRRPSVRDRRGNLVSEKDIAEMIYAGCFVNMLIRPWVQNNEHGKKINANLIGVQFVKDGERFGEAPINDDDAWDTLDDEDDLSTDLDDDDDL